MTALFEKALSRAKELPDVRLDELAAVMLEEMDSEDRWEEKFAKHPEVIERLLRDADADIAAGRVTQGGWNDA